MNHAAAILVRLVFLANLAMFAATWFLVFPEDSIQSLISRARVVLVRILP
jgi:hypothetical protein